MDIIKKIFQVKGITFIITLLGIFIGSKIEGHATMGGNKAILGMLVGLILGFVSSVFYVVKN